MGGMWESARHVRWSALQLAGMRCQLQPQIGGPRMLLESLCVLETSAVTGMAQNQPALIAVD